MKESEDQVPVDTEQKDDTTLTSPWLSQQEAADYLKVHPETIRRYTSRGLKRYGTGKGQKYLRTDLDAFVVNRP